MGRDRFICGTCDLEFLSFNAFLQHKSEGCQVHEVAPDNEQTTSAVDGAPAQMEVVQVVAELVEMKELTEEDHQQDQYDQSAEVQLVLEDGVTDQLGETAEKAIVGDSEVSASQPDLSLIPVSTAGVPDTVTGAVKPPARRRGRPRKGEEKNREKVAPKNLQIREERPPLPEKGKDGQYPCPRCKKSFKKERHYTTHKCLANSDYVDITKKEAFGSDEDYISEEEEDTDRTLEYRMPAQGRSNRKKDGQKQGHPQLTAVPVKAIPSGENDGTGTQTTLGNEAGLGQVVTGKTGTQVQQELGGDTNLLGPPAEPPDTETAPLGEIAQQAIPGMNPLSADPKLPVPVDSEVTMDSNLSLSSLITARQQVPAIPIFQDEEEKMAFEESLDVDLSQVDCMFKTHVIEQNVHDGSTLSVARSSSELTIFSCNECDKVFKTASHMRLHCLTHTHFKPFKCPKCPYASNSKGNLYTHMRKHTGQYYRCRHCDFKSVNKSHLVEHEATHSKIRVKCQLCHKDYNTVKSLINHVRKYHNHTRSGRVYLEKFQGKHQKGTAVLHQCHVCNRKFKKKLDRDRHLFVHDIKDSSNVHPCQLCPYTASRRIYLEKHFHKHRVVYVCSVCGIKFPSTTRLSSHLTDTHVSEEANAGWGELFQASIEASLFLPEPDGSLSDLGTPYGNSKENKVGENEKSQQEHESKSQYVQYNQAQDVNNLPSQIENEQEFLGEEQSAVSSQPDTAEPVESNLNSVDSQITQAAVTSKQLENNSRVPLECAAENEDSNYHLESVEDGEGVPEAAEENALLGSVKDTKESTSDVQDSAMEQLGQGDSLPGLSGDSEGLANGELSASLEGQTGNTDPEDVQDVEGDDEDAEAEALEKKEDYDIYKQLGFMKMSMDVFHKLRQNFGNEECEFCGRLFYSRIDFEPHLRTHTGDRPFSCDQCDYKAITKDNLKRHIEKEHEKLKYVCNECDFVANSRTQLWHHQQKHKLPQKVTCPKCNIEFTSLKRFRVHLSLKHPTMNPDEVKKLTGVYHKAQGKLGRRSYKCPYCEKTFMRASSDLQKHIWIHEGIKPFKCPLCPHACRSKNNLMAHMLRHSQEKPFLCMDCGKAYKSKTALRWHVRTHKDGKIFKCTRCPYEAVQKSHLKRHMETHEVVKRYVCQHCDYSANTLGYMKIHYTRQHKGLQYTYNPITLKTTQPDTKVYRCLSCDYLFGNLSDMKRHLKIRHHVQVEDIRALENLDTQQDAQILPTTAADQHIPQSEVQVVQFTEPDSTSVEEADATAALQALQYAVPSGDMDEKTASAVNILQQIIGMSQQGAFSQQQITVQSEDGQMVAVNPDTIIVQQDGEEVVVASGDHGDEPPNEYVIQYVTNDSMEELAHTDVANEIVTEGVDTMATIENMEAKVIATGPQVITTATDILARSAEMVSLPTNSSQTVVMDANQALNVHTIEIQGAGPTVIGPDGVIVPEYVTMGFQEGLQEAEEVMEIGPDGQMDPEIHQYAIDPAQTINVQSTGVS